MICYRFKITNVKIRTLHNKLREGYFLQAIYKSEKLIYLNSNTAMLYVCKLKYHTKSIDSFLTRNSNF